MNDYLRNNKLQEISGVIFNAYPDSCGGNIKNLIDIFEKESFKEAFSIIYILPSLFKSDLDRGFSVISYDLNHDLAENEDLEKFQKMNISLKLDFVLNHLSAQSPQFLDLMEKGVKSEYVNYFIDWNKFWNGKGEICSEGYIIPYDKYLKKLFMRKPDLPILKIPFPDGTYRFYWNTFYQNISVSLPEPKDLLFLEGVNLNDGGKIILLIKNALEEGISIYKIDFDIYSHHKISIIKYFERNCFTYQGQMDLNADSEEVWQFYEQTIEKLKNYGSKIIRLDAFAYLHKESGLSNFFNIPGTWNYLDRIRNIADKYGISLLPEIHSKYEENIHEELSEKGYLIYDFFFPGLVINAIESKQNTLLLSWIREIVEKKFKTVNMLGCHDGIPVLDVKGLLNNGSIDELIETIKNRGGRIKDLYGADGKKISYYQINATFFSALNNDTDKFLMARAIQMFTPGIPEIWYLDLFAGKNDYEAADKNGHKEINRTNLTAMEIDAALNKSIVKDQLKLIKFRNNFPAFGFDSKLTIENTAANLIKLIWEKNGYKAYLSADLNTCKYEIYYENNNGKGIQLF